MTFPWLYFQENTLPESTGFSFRDLPVVTAQKPY